MASYAENRKARFKFEVKDTIEAGIELLGTEVKSVRAGKIIIAGSHAWVRGREVFLVGAQIPAYQTKNAPADYDPERPRKLLLSRKEISELDNFAEGKGLTLVPLSVYNKGRVIKVLLGLVRGKKNRDKRESIKKREAEREIKRTLKYK